MKKTIWAIVIIIILAFGCFLWHKSNVQTPPNPADQTNITNTKTFVSADQSITFNYPTVLSASQKNNIITLHHQIAYKNHPFCDFKGDAPDSPTLTDFNTTIQLLNMTVASSAVAINIGISTTTDTANDVLKLNPGFIDAYNTGSYNGYMVTQGVEGCGMVTYFLPLSSSRTLIIRKDLIGALSDAADTSTRAKILAVPGVISADQSNTIFNSIIQTLQVR